MIKNSFGNASRPVASPSLLAAAIPHGREKAVEAVVAATRERVAAGLPAPAFGSEPAQFLAILRGGRQP